MSFTIISTFSGCGGSSLGYKLAGGDVRLAVEWDDNAVETYRLNFPDTPIYHGDIAKVSIDDCWQLSSLKPGELDILDGSPPCQGFSTAGKRDFGDDRNQLFREFVRLLRGLKPRVFVMENVSGMVKGKMKLIFVECLRELKASGYKVRARVLNAMYFNVPQSRQRMIFIGVRDDLGIKPSHPKGQSRPVTVGEAIADIEDEPADLAFNPNTLTAQAMLRAKPGESDPRHFSTARLEYCKPSPTLRKDFLGYLHYWHPARFRPLNLAEWKRLGGFPDDYCFTDKKNGCQRIGNSVPPNFMRAIAEHIYDTILPTPSAPAPPATPSSSS